MEAQLESIRLNVTASTAYAVRFARRPDELQAALALRFAVFNLELRAGCASSFATGLDMDSFDAVCDHLIVEHLPTRTVVGTYRLQTGRNAAAKLGYYSAQEFEFDVYEPWRDEMVELGRACVHRSHRNLVVLGLLWKGIADYARERGGRYLVGCSSITSTDPLVGASLYSDLCRRHLVEPRWRTQPRPEYYCPLNYMADETPTVPKLLRAYLTIGAKICGPPALDLDFKTMPFLTLLDLETLSSVVRARFMG